MASAALGLQKKRLTSLLLLVAASPIEDDAWRQALTHVGAVLLADVWDSYAREVTLETHDALSRSVARPSQLPMNGVRFGSAGSEQLLDELEIAAGGWRERLRMDTQRVIAKTSWVGVVQLERLIKDLASVEVEFGASTSEQLRHLHRERAASRKSDTVWQTESLIDRIDRVEQLLSETDLLIEEAFRAQRGFRPWSSIA